MEYIIILIIAIIYWLFVRVLARLLSSHSPKEITKARVDGILYDPVDATYIRVGDLVWDTEDDSFGVCDKRVGDTIVIKHNNSRAEAPISRVKKLIPTIDSIMN